MGDTEYQRPASINTFNMVQGAVHDDLDEINNIANRSNESEATTSQLLADSEAGVSPPNVVKTTIDGHKQREEKVCTSNRVKVATNSCVLSDSEARRGESEAEICSYTKVLGI